MEGSNEEAGRRDVRKLRIRYPGVCSVCQRELTRGTEAWWDKDAKEVTCLVCGSGTELARDLAGTAGASGRKKFERMHEQREQSVKNRFGRRVGGVVLALSDDPQSTRAWRTGSAGEERLARFFECELPSQ